jgi:hypothetical protein
MAYVNEIFHYAPFNYSLMQPVRFQRGEADDTPCAVSLAAIGSLVIAVTYFPGRRKNGSNHGNSPAPITTRNRIRVSSRVKPASYLRASEL